MPAIPVVAVALLGGTMSPRSVAAQIGPNDIIYAHGGPQHMDALWTMNVVSKAAKKLTTKCPVTNKPSNSVCRFFRPVVAPGGNRIGFIVEVSSAQGELHCRTLWTMKVDQSAPKQLTSGGDCGEFPSLAWSPDGRTIVFTRTQPSGIFTASVCNASLPIPPSKHIRLTSGGSPSYSRDGAWIVFVRDGHIWKIRPNGTGEVKLTNQGTNWSPRWTRPGTVGGNADVLDQIIFISDRQVPTGEVYSMNANGGNVKRLTTPPPSPPQPPPPTRKGDPGFLTLPVGFVFTEGKEMSSIMLRGSGAPQKIAEGKNPAFGDGTNVTPCPA